MPADDEKMVNAIRENMFMYACVYIHGIFDQQVHKHTQFVYLMNENKINNNKKKR